MKRTIANTDYQFKEDDISIAKLRFWPENPRIYADLYSLYDENAPDFTNPQLQQKIYDELRSHDDVRELREQIENAGLMEPLIIRQNSRDNVYDVLEGNRRLAACRMIIERAKGRKLTETIKKFSTISCEVVPKNFPENHVFALLGTLHITGKLPWEPFAKASYVKRRVEALKKGGLPEDSALESAGKEFGETKQTVKIFIANIDLMKYAEEQKTTKYSFYDVLNRNITTRRDLEEDELKRRWVESIREWSGKATEFRASVKATVKDPRALKAFRAGKLNLEESAQRAEDNGSTDVIYQKVKKFRGSIANAKPRIKKMDSTDKVFKKLRFEFKHLKTLANEIFNILEKKSG